MHAITPIKNMYNILDLREKELVDLKAIADEMNIKRFESLSKDELVYRILDEQAISKAAEKKAEFSDNDDPKKRRVRMKPNNKTAPGLFNDQKKPSPAAQPSSSPKPENAVAPAQSPAKPEAPKATPTQQAEQDVRAATR